MFQIIIGEIVNREREGMRILNMGWDQYKKYNKNIFTKNCRPGKGWEPSLDWSGGDRLLGEPLPAPFCYRDLQHLLNGWLCFPEVFTCLQNRCSLKPLSNPTSSGGSLRTSGCFSGVRIFQTTTGEGGHVGSGLFACKIFDECNNGRWTCWWQCWGTRSPACGCWTSCWPHSSPSPSKPRPPSSCELPVVQG